jgi:hypothetical protein
MDVTATTDENGETTITETAAPTEPPPDTFNLVPFFRDSEDEKLVEWLDKTLPAEVSDEFDSAWESSSEWREKRLIRIKLLLGNLDKKTEPWEGCATIHIPVMMERVLRIVHRIVAEIFPDKDFVCNTVAPSPAEQDRVDAINLHQNWQFRQEIEDFYKQNRRAVFEFIAHGDCIIHSYRDIAGRRNRHEFLPCDDFVFPYVWRTNAVDMSDVPYKTRILRKTKNELLDMEDAGIYSGVSELFERDGPVDSLSLDTATRDMIDEFEGREKQESDERSERREILEHHCWKRIPGQKRDVPLVVTMDREARKVLCISRREEPDWRDQQRHDRQTQEYVQYHEQAKAFMAAKTAEMQIADRLMAPDVPPHEAGQLMQHIEQNPLPMPQPAPWMRVGPEGHYLPPEPVRQIPIEQFSHGVCIENPDGSLGLGIGLLLEPFNKAADILMSNYGDSAQMANCPPLVTHDATLPISGDVRVKPGEVIRLRNISPENIGKAFSVIPIPPANQQLLEMVKLQLDSADGVSSAPDVLSGEAGKANETFRGIATRVEQATKQMSVLAGNYLEFLGNVIKNNAKLNARFLGDDEVVSVLDPRTQQNQQIRVGRDLYQQDYRIIFTADVRFASKQQRIQEADDILMMMTRALPPGLAPNIFPPSAIRAAVVNCLKARGAYDILAFVPPPQVLEQQLAQQQMQQQQMQQMQLAAHTPSPPKPPGQPSPPSMKIPVESKPMI